MKNGLFVLSLDFELVWGVFDVVDIENQKEYFRSTRKVISEILSLFKRYEIHATWAVVGMLFNKNWEEWRKNKPKQIPQYNNSILSSYTFGEKWEQKRDLQELFFAPEIISVIRKIPHQEIGTHTYSHYYCLEPGQSIKEFDADLGEAVNLARQKRLELKSLVFPRNQLSREYLKICSKWGIENVRSNPDSWYWKNPSSNNILIRAGRTLDAYLPLGKKTYSYEKPNDYALLLEQRASRFYRPYEKNSLLRNLKLRRIKNEMTRAAEKGEIYHLWWHPHNFGTNPKESLKDLEIVLSHYSFLKGKYNFESHNMEEVGDLLKN